MTAEPSSRVRYDAESLLEVAVRVFTERGFEGTSMEQLARAAGITKSSIYHHVTSKDQLLEWSLDRALDGLFGVLDTQPDLPAIERLEHMIRGSVRVLVEQQPHVTLLLRVRGNTEVEQQALARRRQFDRAVAKLVADAEQDGDLRPDADVALSARLVFGMVNSVTEWYRPGKSLDASRLADAIVHLALDGLRRQ